MSVPLLIKYSQANLNSIKDVNPFELLKKLSGNHTCYFYYQEAHKGHKKLGVKIKDSEWVFIVEFGNDGIHLINPWFKKQRLLNPNEESEAIISDCTLYFDDSRNPAILTYMNKGIKDIAEVSNLISKCEKLKKPIVLPENNVDKEIWVLRSSRDSGGVGSGHCVGSHIYSPFCANYSISDKFFIRLNE